MPRKGYKYCMVPLCKSTTTATPEKLFCSLPKGQIRKKWIKAARRSNMCTKLSNASTLFVCEDHFCLEKDMQNYTQWKLMGVDRVRMRKGVVPHKFECQKRGPNIPPGLGSASKRKERPSSCSVMGCINGPGNTSLGVSYHEFPRDPVLQADWVRFCGRPPKWRPGTRHHICSNHFSEDQLDRTSSPSHPKLIEGARPNVLCTSTGHNEPGNSQTTNNRKRSTPAAQPSVATFEPVVVIKEEPIDIDENPVPSTSRTDQEFILPCTDSFQSGSTPTVGEAFTVVKTEPVDEDEPQTNSKGNTTKARKRKAADVRQCESPAHRLDENSATKNSNTKDHFDVYGEYIAAKLRKLDWKSCACVQKAFGEILFDAEMGKFK